MLFYSYHTQERSINMEQINYTINTKNNQRFKKKHFNHLTWADRLNIQHLLGLKNNKKYNGPKITCAYIAAVIGVNKSTISREIKKGTYSDHHHMTGKPQNRYLASYAQGAYNKNLKRSHYKYKLQKDSNELKEIAKLLNYGADPHTALYLYKQKHNFKFPLCEKSIYNYYKRGFLKLKRNCINPRKHKQKVEKTQKMIQKGDNISNRPEKANTREEFGHWEGDLILGAKNKSKECLFTMIERKTRLYLSFKIPNKEMKTIVNLFNQIETNIGSNDFVNIFKSITFDNGSEFRDFKGMETSILTNCTRTKIYYANPYHSWERGSNENGNRLMRKFFPKGTNFSTISNKTILSATNKINFSIRELLNNNSSAETLKKLNNTFYNVIELLGLQNPYLNYLSN